MATLTAQQAVLTGLTASYAACAAGGDQFANTGKSMIHVKNGSAGALTVTVNSQTACSQGVDHDAVVSVPAGSEEMIGPFQKARFDDANGDVLITYSAVTTLTIAVVELP